MYDKELFSQLENTLSPFDPVDLLLTMGALQLVPENMNCAIRIEALAYISFCINYEENKPSISIKKIKQTLTAPPLGGSMYEMYEDPCTNHFTENIEYFGGNYTVFPGISEDASFIQDHLNRAINFGSSFDDRFKNYISHITEAILSLSNEVANRIGVGRYQRTPPPPENIVFPFELNDLKSALVFSSDELIEIISPHYMAILSPFIAKFGDISLEQYDIEYNPLFNKPILEHEDSLIVFYPWMLLSALKHHILVFSDRAGVLDKVIDEYQKVITGSVVSCLELTKWKPLNLDLPTDEMNHKFEQNFWLFDTDKIAHVIVYSGTLEDIEPDKQIVHANNDSFAEFLDEHFSVAEEYIFEKYDTNVNEIFYIVILGPLGNNFGLGLNGNKLKSNPPIGLFTAPDLYLLTYLDGKDRLFLYKFVLAQIELRKKTRVLAWSALGEYELYRDKKYSFYMSDDVKDLKALTLEADFGKRLTEKHFSSFDPHLVPYFRDGILAPVVNFFQSEDIPIYIPNDFWWNEKRELYIDGDAFGIWVLVRKEELEDDRLTNMHSDLLALLDFLSYWLWQINNNLQEIGKIYSVPKITSLSLNVDYEKSWDFDNELDKFIDDAPPISWTFEDGMINLFFAPDTDNLLNSYTNDGELKIIEYVVNAIGEYWRKLGFTEAANSLLANLPQCLDAHRLPFKKKTLLLDPSTTPQIRLVNNASYRSVQANDIALTLERVGGICTSELRLSPGLIPFENRKNILNNIVQFLFSDFESIIATLSNDNLLEFMITQYEAIIVERTIRNITLPTNLACFEQAEDYVSELSESVSKVNEASRACRFIIEYIGTCPPKGTRPISLKVFDKLMALSSQIMSRGNQSDLIEYDIHNVELSILPSGRIAHNYEEHEILQMGFLNTYMRESISSSRNSFSSHWHKREDESTYSEDVTEINNAFEDEFKFSIQDLSDYISSIANFPSDNTHTAFSSSPEDIFYQQIQNATKMQEEKIKTITEFLTLYPRDRFLNPPEPYENHDIYPWRFSRGLSYLRKPLIQLEQDNKLYFCWGTRNLFDAWDYILRNTFNGRLQIRYASSKMRKWMGKQNNISGKTFNNNIAERAKDLYPHLIIDKEVKKIGGHRIGSSGLNLGDIDLLMIIPNHKTILVIECKDFNIARTPFEMYHELKELIFDENSTSIKHLKRLKWVEKNKKMVLQSYKMKSRGKWSLIPLILVSNELMSSHYQTSPIKIMSEIIFFEDYLPGILR